MSSPELLYQRDECLIVALLFALLLVAAEVGFRRGRRIASGLGDATRSEFSTLQGSLGGLLALLLAFTFAMAVTRFETRKDLVVEEAAAIGNAASRARMMPAPYGGAALDLFRQYTDNRVTAYNLAVQSQAVGQADEQLASLQKQLWHVAQQAAAKNPNVVPTGLFIDSLATVFDVQAKRDAARDNHVPESILLLLFLVAVLTMGLVGYGCGLTAQRHFGATGAIALAVSMVILIIVDLDRPGEGLIRVPQKIMVDLRQRLDEPDARY